MANPNVLRFGSLPESLQAQCEGLGTGMLIRLCEPYLVVRSSSDAEGAAGASVAGEPEPVAAGDGAHELSTVHHPADDMYASLITTRQRLGVIRGWRNVLSPSHVCLPSGFSAPLSGLSGDGPVPRWASEEHYVLASVFLDGRAEKTESCLAIVRQFMLDSGSAISRDPLAARAFAQSQATEKNIHSTQAAAWRAKVARYSQHALSRAVLAATEFSLILTAQSSAQAQAPVDVMTMVVRAALAQSRNIPPEFPAEYSTVHRRSGPPAYAR